MKLRNILNEIKIQNPNSREAILIRFLKQNNAYEAFIENIKNQREFNSIEELLKNNTLLSGNLLSNIFMESFSWKDSNQDWVYWNNLHLKWKEYLKHLKLNEIRIENPNSIENIFFNFLKKEGAYEAFIENSLEKFETLENIRNFLSRKKKKNSAKEFISTAFIWDDSIQGLSYWNNINLKWKEIIKNLKLNEIKVVNPSKITIYIKENNHTDRIKIGEFQDFRFPLIIEEKNIKIFYQLGSFSKTKKLTSIEQDARDFISFLIRKRKLNYHQDSLGIGGSIMVFSRDDFNVIYK